MKMIESFKEKLGSWLFGVALKKGAMRVVQLIISWVGSQNLSQYGVAIGFDEERFFLAVLGGLTLLIEVARNFLKQKLGLKFL